LPIKYRLKPRIAINPIRPAAGRKPTFIQPRSNPPNFSETKKEGTDGKIVGN